MGESSRDRGGGLRSVERAIEVLNILAEHPSGLSMADLSRTTGVPMTTLHRLLGVLRAASLVAETAAGRYVVGSGTVVLGRAFLDGLDLREAARPAMSDVVARTSETCHLGILASVQIVYIEKVDSPHPVRMYSRVGGTNPALSTAIGRAILAHSPSTVVDEVLEGSRRLFGDGIPVQDVEGLLEHVRRDGYSTDLQDNEAGICCVGAPVFDHGGRPVAGISLSTPATRFQASRLDETGRLVQDAAARISAALGWAGPATDGRGSGDD